MHTSKNIFLWALYDFANSLVSIVFFLYFAQWVVIEKGLSDLSFNLTFTISTIFLICTAPFLGVMLDKKLRRRATNRDKMLECNPLIILHGDIELLLARTMLILWRSPVDFIGNHTCYPTN